MKLPVLFVSILFFSCSPPKPLNLPFDFDQPSEVIKLPQKLHEISGICFYQKKELACVQDEKGVVYFYDIKKDKLRSTISFAKDRDYEGVADVNDTIYVLCSNGNICEIDGEDQEVKQYGTLLSKDNNCEGLCFDGKNHRLLIACKGKPKKGTAAKGMKAVYAFNIENKKVDEEPVYVIDPDSVKAHLIQFRETGIFSFFDKPQNPEAFLFEPSEIGIDPLTDDIYVLSSVGKTILCMSREGKIKYAFHLNPHLFKQPEGLAFAKDGSLFISDEGREGKANLVRLSRNETN